MSELSANEAAQRLQVSPRRVRALLESGALPGRQIAGRWVVNSRAVEQRQDASPPSGRPLSPASAWRALAVLAGTEEESPVAPSARSRARRQAEELRKRHEAPGGWSSALRARASIADCYAHPGILPRLLNDPAVVPSGISAAPEHRVPLMVSGAAEGYVRASDLESLQARYALSRDDGRANVRLHVVDDCQAVPVWLFRCPVAPAPVVAADLMERDTPRDRAAGAELAASL
jgi:hypothetical protein